MSEYIKEYFENNTWLRKENANQRPSFSNLKGYVSGKAIKAHTLAKYPEEIRNLHENGDIHIHDLSNGIVPYCNGIDFLQLLNEGLITDRVVSVPPKHFDTALNQLLNRFMTEQQEWAGAMAANDVNTLLAPFVAKDRLSYDEVEQATQRFVWDVNYPSRGGWETPFINTMFNTKCPEHLMEISPLHFPDDTYADFQDESIMILRAFNKVLGKGDGKGMPFTFPIPTINAIKSTNFKDDIWHEISETMAQFGTWYVMNFIGSGIPENSVRSMCCRVLIDYSELADAGGRWAMQGSTGSIGVVTLNMSRIGFLAKDETGFFERLDFLLEKAKESLLLKEEWCVEMLENGYMPMSAIYGLDFNRYFRTIGVIGLNEMCLNFLGSSLRESKPFVMKVMEYIREWCRNTQLETKKLWNDEITPGESAATRFAMLDRAKFDGIITLGTDKAPYYTTVLIPSNEYVTIAEKIRVEQDILNLFSGGTVCRFNIGESRPDAEGLRKLTERVAKNSTVPYFDWANTFSICNKCKAWIPGLVMKCSCGGSTRRFARITGYYQDVDRANIGKYQEIMDRVKYHI